MFRSPESQPYISEVEPVELPVIQYGTEVRWYEVRQEREMQLIAS